MAANEFFEFQTKSTFLSNHGKWDGNQKFSIGTRSFRSLRDALSLTSVPSQLKKKNPGSKIYVYRRRMNQAVFKGNPHVDGFRLLLSSFEKAEELSEFRGKKNLKPQLYVTSQEKSKIQAFLQKKLLPTHRTKPLCMIHAWKSQGQPLAPVEFWDQLVARWSGSFRFWQVGLQNDPAIQGCEYYFLPKRSSANLRRLIALTHESSAFVGIDSSPRDIANSFQIPTLIFLNPLEQFSKQGYDEAAPFSFSGPVNQGIEMADKFFANLIHKKG